MYQSITKQTSERSGFSLIEVVLALGIFLISILALVGLVGPSLKSIDEIEVTDEIPSIINTLNAFLQTSPDIASGSNFNAIYNSVYEDGYATVYIFRYYVDGTEPDEPPVVRLEVGFDADESASVDTAALVESTRFKDAAGPIYRIVLTPSSVLPSEMASDGGDGVFPRYSLKNDLINYTEGSFAMEARIFRREADQAVIQGANLPLVDVITLGSEEPLFTYNLAVVR